jgi:type IV pilus assembly protein PilV
MKISTRESQQGVVILETLVAVLIFSFGILGLIGLQANTAKYGVNARFRTEAASLTDELVARMMLYPAATLQADFQNGGNEFTSWESCRVDLTSGTTSSSNVACPIDSAIHGLLPNGNGTVTVAPTVAGGFTARIVISWQAPGQADAASHVSLAAIPGGTPAILPVPGGNP